MAQVNSIHWTPQDVIALAQKAVGRQIALFQQGRCRLHIPLLPPSQRPCGSHFHLFPELLILVSGEKVFDFPPIALRIGRQQMCLVPRLVAHAVRETLSRESYRFLVIAPHQGRLSVILGDNNTEKNPGHHQRPSALFVSAKADLVEQYLNDIARHSQPGGNKLAGRGLLLAMLAELLEVLHSPFADTMGHYKVVQCRRLVRDHIGDTSLSVHRLAAWVHCSNDYLSRLFRSQMGIRLADYINQHRIAHACQLLDHTTLNISEVAIACGYVRPGYFTRVFRKTVKKTPKQYRHLPKSKV